MMPLIRNELYKLFRMKKLYIFAAVMVVVLVLNLYNYEPGEDPMVIWTFMYGQSVPLNTLDFLTQFMVIFIPILAGDSVTQEYRRGHMKLSLLRPVLRSELLLAKLAALLVFIIVMALFYTAASYAIGSYYLGLGGRNGICRTNRIRCGRGSAYAVGGRAADRSVHGIRPVHGGHRGVVPQYEFHDHLHAGHHYDCAEPEHH